MIRPPTVRPSPTRKKSLNTPKIVICCDKTTHVPFPLYSRTILFFTLSCILFSLFITNSPTRQNHKPHLLLAVCHAHVPLPLHIFPLRRSAKDLSLPSPFPLSKSPNARFSQLTRPHPHLATALFLLFPLDPRFQFLRVGTAPGPADPASAPPPG